MRASEKQISYIRHLGRQLGLMVTDTPSGGATGLDHVLSSATFGRREHWASLQNYEASAAIKELQRRLKDKE